MILSGKIPGDDWKELMNLKEICSMEKQLDKIALACTISLLFSIPELPFGSLPFGITSLNQVKT